MKKTTVTRTSLPPFEEFCAQIRPLWDSRILTNMGTLHEAFRAALEQYLEVPHAVPFTNGHLALEAALRALRLPAGAEVVTTPFTFVSTVHAIVRCGFVPVFCDVREEDGTLDPALTEPLLTERTAAVLPVHVYGNVCDVERIGALAARHGLKVLYDAGARVQRSAERGERGALRRRLGVQFPRHEGLFHRRGRGGVHGRRDPAAGVGRREEFRHPG